MRRIAHISDLHFGAEDPAAVEALARDLHSWPCDLLVVSGDLTQRARRRQFKQAADFLKRLNRRWLCIPGNHDIPLYDVARRFLSPLGQYRRLITPALSPVFRDEQLVVAGLNSARAFSPTWTGFWKDGRLSQEQLKQVETLAAPVPEELFKVVVTHHPFIPPPGERPHGIIRHATRALAALESVGVEVLLAGHLHLNYSGDVRTHHEATKRSILSIQAGTACSRRRRDEPNAYNRLTVEGAAFDGLRHDRLTVQVRRCDSGSVGFHDGAQVVYEKHAEGWEQIKAQREDPMAAIEARIAARTDEDAGAP